jgi:hypothetical protein
MAKTRKASRNVLSTAVHHVKKTVRKAVKLTKDVITKGLKGVRKFGNKVLKKSSSVMRNITKKASRRH